MTDDLVKQRRKYAAHLRDVGYEPIADAFIEDADRIEALTAEIERLREELTVAQDYKECACSYDDPDDICLGHMKLFERLKARAALGDTQ